MKRINLRRLAREIVIQNQYMTLGTVNSEGLVWVAPVVYAMDNKFNLYWMSLTSSKHSQNIETNPNISAAIFDSHQLIGTGVGLQIEGKAKMVSVVEFPVAFKVYTGRKWPDGKLGDLKNFRRFFSIFKYKFYKLSPTTVWMNDPREKVDVRVKVKLG